MRNTLRWPLPKDGSSYTQDADFLRLAQQGNPHAGVVYAAQQTSVGAIIRGLLLVSYALSAQDMVGNIEFL